MSTKTVSAVELAAAHEATLTEWQKQLAALDAEITELTDYEISVRMEYQAEHPSSRSDTLDSPVTKLRKRIDDLVGKRQRLAKDVEAKRQILEDLRGQADAELAEAERREHEATIRATEQELASAWAEFVGAAEKLREQWPAIVSLTMTLDGLPSGSTPVAPFPSTLSKAVERALTEPGNEPYAEDPRIVARRLSTSGGSAAMDTRGFSNTLSQLGDY